MTDERPLDPPSPFIEHWIDVLSPQIPAPRRALDIAMGRGRHAIVLAAAGFRVFGVDITHGLVRDVVVRAADQGLVVRGWCADLTVAPIPPGRFELVVVTRYLQRDLWLPLAETLTPGGILLYETFTEAQRAHGRGPTSPDHLLRPRELAHVFRGLETLFYEEIVEPDALARLAARRRPNPS
jgi:SAM-dependent methyltransferase